MTSRDVAKLAGVSQATVSRVLHNNPRVGEVRRQRVLAALEASGYVANAHARAMRTNRTGTIGVVTARITNPFYPELIESLAAALTAAGHRMILWTSGSSGEQAALDSVQSGTVDGVIFTTATAESRVLRAAIDRRSPIVLVNRSIDGAPCDQVTSDNASGGRLVADFFLTNDHTRLAVIGGDSAISTGRERRAGFLERVRESGHKVSKRMAPATDFSHSAGRAAGLSLLKGATPPTAIFCVNDLLAFGVIDATRELGVRVPEDVWIAGYDDVAMASWRSFDLTTVRQPTDEMARVVVDMLLRRLDEPDRPIEHRRFGTELIIRSSTGPVQRANSSAQASASQGRPTEAV